MANRLLLVLALYVLFTSFQCEDCDFPTALSSLELTVTRGDNGYEYAVGDTLWVATDFPAALPGDDLRITEGGGLILVDFYRLVGGDTLAAARDRFNTVVTRGDLLPITNEQVESVRAVRFTCPGGRCGYRQAFIPREPGQYALTVRGGPVDVVDAEITLCRDPSFNRTTLVGMDNLDALPATVSLLGFRATPFPDANVAAFSILVR